MPAKGCPLDIPKSRFLQLLKWEVNFQGRQPNALGDVGELDGELEDRFRTTRQLRVDTLVAESCQLSCALSERQHSSVLLHPRVDLRPVGSFEAFQAKPFDSQAGDDGAIGHRAA